MQAPVFEMAALPTKRYAGLNGKRSYSMKRLNRSLIPDVMVRGRVLGSKACREGPEANRDTGEDD